MEMEQTTCAYYLPISHKNGKSISATHNNSYMMIKQKANKETNISTGVSLPYQNPQYLKYSFSMFFIPIPSLGFCVCASQGPKPSTMCQFSTTGCCCTVQIADAGWCQVMPRSPFCWGGLFAKAYYVWAFLVVIIPQESLENTSI